MGKYAADAHDKQAASRGRSLAAPSGSLGASARSAVRSPSPLTDVFRCIGGAAASHFLLMLSRVGAVPRRDGVPGPHAEACFRTRHGALGLWRLHAGHQHVYSLSSSSPRRAWPVAFVCMRVASARTTTAPIA